jgi:CRP-like cAMP-binding protein
VFDNATCALSRAVDHMMKVGRGSAEERLAWFLWMLSGRASGQRATLIELTMPRQDIADYLGVTNETISRTLSKLKAQGVIALPTPRRVDILRPDLLKRVASNDRDRLPSYSIPLT